MSIDFYGGKLAGNNMDRVGTLSVNMTERHLVITLDALGIIADPCGHLDIDQFLGLARSWLQRHINKPSAEIETRERRGDLGCRVIDLPVRAGYVNQNLHRIVTMLATCKQQGATHVYWG